MSSVRHREGAMNEIELMDRRLVERNIRKGKVTAKEFQTFLTDLPDRKDNAEEMEYDEELLQAHQPLPSVLNPKRT